MKLRFASALAFTAFLVIPAPSMALNFDELLQNYLGVARPGTSQDIGSNEQGIVKQNINIRQAQLESQVQAGVASGQLNSDEENDLRAELNRIAANEGSYLSDGNYNRFEVQSMLDQLNNFSVKLESYLSNATTRFVATQGNNRDRWGRNNWYRRNFKGPNDGDLQNLQAFRADVDTKQAQLDAAITDGVSSGRLSWRDSTSLRGELNQIANNETTMTADGRLSHSEAQQLITQLDTLNTKLTAKLAQPNWNNNRGRHGRGGSVSARQSLLRQRISQGMASGRLTRAEATKLLADESRISDLQARLRNNDGRISFDEQRRLFNQLDELSRRINKELNDHQVQ